jgi:hypothetical protein
MERRASLLLLIILMGISISYAVSPPVIELPELGIAFVLLVGLVSVGIIALLYMLGSSLEMPNLTAMAKENLKELIVGAVIVVLVWSVVIGGDTIVGAIFLQDGAPDNIPELGASALQPHIDYLETLYLKTTDAYQAVAFYQSFSYFASLGLYYVYVGQGESPYFGAGIVLGSLSNAANTLTVQILTFRLLKVFTYYIAEIFPAFILPIALAFRLFPLTRKMGNTLIAICLGAIFVFPLSMVFVGDIWGDDLSWKYKTSVESTDFTFDKMGLGSDFMNGILGVVDFVCGNVVMRTILSLGEFFWSLVFALIFGLFGLPYLYGVYFVAGFQWFLWVLWPLLVTFSQLSIAGTILVIFAIGDNLAGTGVAFNSIPQILLPAVAEATGVSIVSFFIIAFITFTGIKSISVALGGDYILYGVSRFV